jgi:benzoate-CoA ligase family protein
MNRNNATLVLDRHVEAGRGGEIACIASDATLTYEELRWRVNRMGHLLLALGLTREQRVLLVLDSTTAFPIAFFGALRIGAVPVPVSASDTPDHFQHFIDDSYADLIVCDPACVPRLKGPLKDRRVRYLVRGLEAEDLVDLDSGLAAQDNELAAVAAHPDDIAFWLYSSGSTGKPKAVVHSHHNLSASCEGFAGAVLRICPEDRIFSSSKFHHAYGLGNGLCVPLHFGATAILRDGPPELEHLLETLREQRPTVYYSVPSLYRLLADDSGADGAFDSVRVCVSAGEPLSAQTFDSCRERFGVQILDGIGSTEMFTTYCTNWPGEVVRGTTGRPVPGYELRLRDERDRIIEGPGVGALEVRGESRAAFYWHEREQSRRCMRGEWFTSGDRFERRADGSYVYIGRNDDMLRIGARWISPTDMEHVLLEHPAVAGVGVVSVSVDGSSRVAAFVECVDGACGDDELASMLRDWCRERMREYEYPHIVRFLDRLPLTLTGKPQRFKLRELAERGVAHSANESRASVHDVAARRGSLARGLRSAPEAEWDAIVSSLVRGEVLAVLGRASFEQFDDTRTFKDLGFDSLSAVALRNRLSERSGLRLASTLAFDHPTPAAVARLLRSRVQGAPEDDECERGEQVIRRVLASIPLARLRRAGVMQTLLDLASADNDALSTSEAHDGVEAIDTMDVGDLVQRILETPRGPPRTGSS